MIVPENIIFVWSGSNGSIPTGWTRETSYDGKYVLGLSGGASVGDTGGAETHNHTVDDHTHTQNAHNHGVSGGAGSGSENSPSTGSSMIIILHTHISRPSFNATAVNQNASVTLNATSNDPPYHEVIFIKSDGTNGFANSMIGFSDLGSLISGWALCDGTAPTPDLRNKFLQGALAGSDAGGTGGSSDSHTHTETATHNHTQNSHTHTNRNSRPGNGATEKRTGSTAPTKALATHRHLVAISTNTATNQVSSVTLQNDDAQPTFRKLAIIQNNTGGDSLVHGLMGLWGSPVASIPNSWVQDSDMDGFFLKGANVLGEIADTGGGDQHTHTADAHTHTQDSHAHTGSGGAPTLVDNSGFGMTASGVASNTHTHVWTVGGTVAVNQNTIVTVNNNTAESNFPPHIVSVFVKFIEQLEVSVDVLSATFSVLDAVADNPFTKAPDVDVISATFSVLSPAVILTKSSFITADVLSLTATVQDATVSVSDSVFINVGIVNATFSVQDANVSMPFIKVVDANVQSAIFSILQPTVSILVNKVIDAEVLSATFTVLNPSVSSFSNAFISVDVLSATFTVIDPFASIPIASGIVKIMLLESEVEKTLTFNSLMEKMVVVESEIEKSIVEESQLPELV